MGHDHSLPGISRVSKDGNAITLSLIHTMGGL